MPTRYERMHSVEEYLSTRESARNPQPIHSAMIVGTCLILIGALILTLCYIAYSELHIVTPMGWFFINLGVALTILGRKGPAKYRVTETTRYPQQTGEIIDMYFQILGEKYLWVLVAAMMGMLMVFAWQMGQF